MIIFYNKTFSKNREKKKTPNNPNDFKTIRDNGILKLDSSPKEETISLYHETNLKLTV